MGNRIFPLSWLKWSIAIVILASLCFIGHHYYDNYQQLKQARRTIGLFKSMSTWPYPMHEEEEDAKKKQENPLFVQATHLPYLYLYSTQFYFSQDTQLKAISDKEHTYLLALSGPHKLDRVLYGLYVVLPEKQLYCLAYPDSVASKAFCQKLGAREKANVDLNWYIQVNGLNAYSIQSIWEEIPPLLDEPIDVWDYKKSQ